ncbi:MAG: ABC transporter permease subunit [Clostridiales bacterium]|jgi:putative aldouronate transport system permease protein|nr:ABC transporter permease subunit [Clostridiales bacterium]
MSGVEEVADGKKAGRFKKHMIRYIYLYLMIAPVIVYYLIFMYAPMFGLQIAFKDYRPSLGMLQSPFVGIKHFTAFFGSYYFERILKNTLLISFYDILFGFPAPIILALILNEQRNALFKRSVQTVTYLPHFVSTVIICGMMVDFLSLNGWVNAILSSLTGRAPTAFLQVPEWFRGIFVGSNIWQEVGWGSIIYLSALSAINEEYYEAARIDGASRWQQLRHITLPGILSTIVIMLIMRVGRVMNVSSEKVLLLYTPNTYETADVISTFVYRKGILESNYGYATAVGLFNSAVNFVLLISVNQLSRKVTDNSLW